MSASEWVQEVWREAVKQTGMVSGCGSCKGTGWQHEWNATADLVEVKPPTPCPACGGLGKVRAADTSGNQTDGS